MVSFSCESCCDVLVKKKLDQHAARCRGAQYTCLDCSTTFQGTSYRQHTSCISEAQKYQKGLFRPEKGRSSRGNGWNGNQRNGFADGGGGGANPNLTPLGEREKEKEKVGEGKGVVGGAKKVVVVVEEREEDGEQEEEEVVLRKKEKGDKKRKRKDEDACVDADADTAEEVDDGEGKDKEAKKSKKEKNDKKRKNKDKNDKTSTAEEKELTNGAVCADETLGQKFLKAISSKKETSISKVIKKLDKKGTEEEVWELLKQAMVRKEVGGKVVLVLP